MIILADQCVHRDVLVALKETGFKVISVREVNLQSAVDNAIYDYALNNNCVLLTFDRDFGNIMRFDIPQSSGIVIVYIEDTSKEEIIKNTLGIFKNFGESQFKGKLFIVEKNRVRTWPK